MKSIRNNSTILLFTLILIVGVGFSACSEDDTAVVPKTLEQYKNELSDFVSHEKEAVENCVVGYDKGNFKVFNETDYDTITTRYMDSLLLAERILAKPDLTIDSIFYANWALTTPGDVFWENVFISDRRPLQERIVYCDTLRAHTPVGSEPGNAPPEADSVFGAAISDARYWRNLASTIDRQVAAEVDSLNQELEIYEEAIIK